MVIATTPFIPSSLGRWLGPRIRGDAEARNYSHDNVDVYFPRNLVVPLEPFKQLRVTSSYAGVRRILEDTGFAPDLVHAHFLWPTGSIALRLKSELNVPYVVTAHGYDVYDLPLRSEYYITVLNAVLADADAVIAVSNDLSRDIRTRFGLDENRITVIPNGYDPTLFHPSDQRSARRKLNLPVEDKFILSVGNSTYQKTSKGLIEKKGHRYLSDAFYQLSQKRSDVIGGIVGDVPEREISAQALLTGRFKLFGRRPHEEIPDWINSCDVFVLPSLKEGLPTVMLEALGCGKPFVGTGVGGIPDVITSNEIGLLVGSGNVAALTEAMLVALNSSWNQEYILEYSRQYTWQQIAERIYNVYLNAASSKHEKT